MRGITIIFNGEDVHTGDDLDLVQEEKTIGKPTIQSYTVQVPGRNGLLNLTKSLTGKVMYYNRSLFFKYFGDGDLERLLELDAVMSGYHGQTIRIIDDDYPDHYYEGEASVSTEFHSGYVNITLTVDAQPFRLKRKPTVVSREVNNNTIEVSIRNESIEAIPTFTIDGNISITFNGEKVSLSTGTYTVERIQFRGGVNVLTISGSGKVTIEYQEGAI